MPTKRPHPFRINLLLTTFFLLSVLYITACKKNKPEPVPPTPEKIFPKAFTVTVKDREADRVTLSWPYEPGAILTYDIELEGKLLATGLNQFEFDLKDLVASRAYTGKVTAHNPDGNTTSSTFDIQLLNQEIYMTNIVDYNWAKTTYDGSGKLYWKIYKGKLLGIPAISGDTIFMGGSTTAIAVNRLTGTLIWSRTASTPDNIALLSYNGKLVLPGESKIDIISSATGSTLWTLNLPEYTEPFISKGILYTSNDQTVYAYDLQTGAKKWEFQSGGKAACPLVNEGTLYFIGDEGNFYALHAADGTLKWKSPFSGSIPVWTHRSPRPCIMGNNVYFSFARNIYDAGGTRFTVRAVDKSNGETLWSRVMGEYLYALRITPSTRLGLCVGADRLYHMDPLTGKDLLHSGAFPSDSYFNVVDNQVFYTYIFSRRFLALATYREKEQGNIFVMPNGDDWWQIPVVVKNGKAYYPAECAMNMME
ncbi:MAG: PQQ-binding-like beta-propeller repeat protein [Sphingobacteriaceae bacterium]|nr:PQQ-binding-like beta-propeller repeat protein [Sphingobacteriaceae bacterium]